MSAGSGVSQAHVEPRTELVDTFRVYQRTGSYAAAAEELELSIPQVKRRLMQLYDDLGIPKEEGGNRAIIASYHLRDTP